MRRKLAVIKNCSECPNSYTERTPGSGYAEDYKCGAAGGREYAGYIEFASQLPGDGEFPDWCPLFDAEDGMYVTPSPASSAESA